MSSRPIDPRLVRRSRAVRKHLFSVGVLGTAAAVLIVAQAWLIAAVIAEGFTGVGLTGGILRALTALVAVFAGRALIDWAHQVLATRAAAQVKSALRREVMGQILSGRPGRQRPESGHVIALLGSGLDALDNYFAKYLPQLILAVTVPLIVVGVMFWTDVIAAVTVALTLPLIVVFMVLVGWMTKAKTERRWLALKRLTHHFTDVLDGMTVLKIFGRSRAQTKGLAIVGERHRRESMGALRLAFLSSMVLELFATISVALVAVGVGLRVVEGDLGLQTALFVLLLAPEAYLPLRQVGAHFHDSADGLAAADDVFALLEDGDDTASRTTTAPDLGVACLRIDRVSVTFPDRADPAVSDASLYVDPGEFVALVGPSGSGKSTLLSVLLGFQLPTSGRVTVGDCDLADLDLADWRRQIAWVPQHPGLLAGSVASNVRLAMPNYAATDADVRAALDSAGATSLALTRDVEESGANLSAGERRRVGVARALLRVRRGGALLLLLDEPTAGLDQDAEATLIASVRASGVTVLAVAHRLSLIESADRVVPLEPARVLA